MNWKNHERQVAKKLGGKRVSRGADFGESAPDVEHDVFSVECKYRKSVGKLCKDALKQSESYDKSKIPLAVLKEHGMKGELVVMWLDDFVKIWEANNDAD